MKPKSNSSNGVKYALEDFLQVDWVDIVAYSGWEEVGQPGPGTAPHACQSFGFLTRQDDEFLTLSATKGVNGRVEYNQSISIPLGCIKDIKLV